MKLTSDEPMPAAEHQSGRLEVPVVGLVVDVRQMEQKFTNLYYVLNEKDKVINDLSDRLTELESAHSNLVDSLDAARSSSKPAKKGAK